MKKIKNVINKIVTKDEVNLRLLSSRIIPSEIDEIRLRNVVLHWSKIIQLILNVLKHDERASKNLQTIRTTKGNWIIAKVIFVGFIKWLGPSENEVLQWHFRREFSHNLKCAYFAEYFPVAASTVPFRFYSSRAVCRLTSVFKANKEILSTWSVLVGFFKKDL